MNFFLGFQRDFLMRDETIAGAHGIEARYPYLDRRVVQEYLWLSDELKNSLYKAPIHFLFRDSSYPFDAGKKYGFVADHSPLTVPPSGAFLELRSGNW